MRPLRVLSLFDGISCGQVALERAEIPVEVYYASEIDKYAIQITQKNYPNTIQLGDINNIDFTQYIGKIDLIMGGSPCQDLSIAGKRAGLSGERSGLFYKFVEAVKTIKPKYFLLENNYGMPQEAYEEMSKLMGCYPIMINSALVSAQTRKRFYWTNIGPQSFNLFGFPTVAMEQPEDKGILLKDVLESGYGCICTDNGNTLKEVQDKSYCSYGITGVAEPICINIPETVTVRKYEVNIESLKTTLKKHKNFTNKEIAERLNQPITKVEHWFRTDNSFSIPDSDIWIQLKNLLNIQTDEFDKSIMEFEEKLSNYDKSNRKYSVNGKMSTLMAGGNDEIIQPLKIPENTKQGYAEINQGECMDLTHLNSKTRRGRAMKEKANCLQTSSEFYQYLEPVRLPEYEKSKGQANRVFSVQHKSVTLCANGGGGGAKTGLYKIDLPDGEYLIRKLTPLECERLQTLPDNYTQGISNTQRYKAIGNGWTVDVIAHILKYIKIKECEVGYE
jgi:DNA-cytosine methyltransferase